MPPGSIVDAEVISEASTSPSFSPSSDEDSQNDDFAALDSDDTKSYEYEQDPVFPLDRSRSNLSSDIHQVTSDSLSLREDLETLLKRQYWRKDWQMNTRITSKFNLGNPSSLSAS